MTVYTAEQLAAHARTWRASTTVPALAAIVGPSARMADRISELMPHVPASVIGEVLLHAGAAATQISDEVGPKEPGMGPVIANTLLLAGEHLYTGGAS